MRTAISMIMVLLFGSKSICQDLSAVLEKHKAIHQVDFWSQVYTFTSEGDLELEGKSYAIDFIATSKGQIKIISKKKDFVFAFDGSAGWKIEEEEGKVLDFELDEVEMFKILFDFGTPLSNKSKLQKMGQVTVDGVSCEWLIFKNNVSKTDYFLRSDNYMLYKINLQYSEGGDKRIVSKKISQYRDFQGIKIPTVTEIKTSEKVMELSLYNMYIGEPVKQSIFQKPDTQ